MEKLTTNEVIFLARLLGGIIGGINDINPKPHTDEDDLSSAYNCAKTLRDKLYREWVKRVEEEDE